MGCSGGLIDNRRRPNLAAVEEKWSESGTQIGLIW